MEREIIEDLLNGETHKFAKLVDKYQQQVANLCYKLGGDAIDVEDATQTVFVELYASLARFKFQAKLSTFIYSIAFNVVSKTIRKNKRYVRLEPEKEYDNMTESAVDKEIIRKEKIDELHKAIDKLKYEQRVALTLHCFEDLSYKEIASIMNASLPKVESLIFRAKNNLKKMLIEQNS